jgi:pimeloyl-ACP methyl ester carboxylesterase
MPNLKTKSFDIASYSSGDISTSRLALVLPGKLDSKDYAHMRSHVRHLASLGYFAMSIDPPGTWESTGDINVYTITNYAKAVEELIEHFGNKQTMLIGHSLGGSISLLVGSRNPYVSHIGMFMSPYNFIDRLNDEKSKTWEQKGYAESKRDIPDKSPPEWRYFKLPYSYLLDQVQYDLTSALKTCSKPKLFIYGEKDDSISAEIVKREYEISISPKELASVDDGHSYRKKPDSINNVNSIISSFLSKYQYETKR